MKRWHYSARVLAPAVLSLGLALAAVAGFVIWSAAEIDARSLERQTAVAKHVIDGQLLKLSIDQQSIVERDETLRHTRPALDRNWIDANLGFWMHSYFGHDQTFVLNEKDEPIYAMDGGRSVDPAALSTEVDEFRALIVKVRGQIARGAVTAYEEGSGASMPHASDFVLVAGKPVMVSVMPIVSNTGQISQRRGEEFLHISVVRMDQDFARRIMDPYLLSDPRFTTLADPRDDSATLTLTNSAGRFIAFLQWQEYRPGLLMINQTGPGLAGIFLVAAVIVFLLLDQLWRSSAALEAGRANAEHQAAHDPLTGLPNRVSFEAALERDMQGKPASSYSVKLLMLDLDRFKQVNDTLGHQAGDDLIRAVGQRLKELVGPADLLARLGGDEFAVIHTNRGGIREALQLSQRIIDALSKPFEIFGSEAFVGASIGVAMAGPMDTDWHELTRCADIALYEAKAAGRNRAVVYEDAMNELLQNRHTIEAELREALKRSDQLKVAFQPLFSRETGQIIGAEALARWNHPKLGQVSPAHFIPVAEGTGLIERLGELVLRRSCELGARWPGLTVAVNISPAQLRNPGFPTRVFQLLHYTGMRPQDLELEITEGILLEDAQVTSEALRTFRDAGLRIALDDFGTGYSSLNYLKRYPVDCIKIDRSFVSQLGTGNVSVPIVQAMVTLAHALNISVTAEGVETTEQMQALTQMGCNTFQGFLLSPPVCAETIETMFGDIRRPLDKQPARVA